MLALTAGEAFSEPANVRPDHLRQHEPSQIVSTVILEEASKIKLQHSYNLIVRLILANQSSH